MERRSFIQIGFKGIAGIYLGSLLLESCSLNTPYNLEDILGTSLENTSSLKKEHAGLIACYSTQNFKHRIAGEKALIFCKDDRVVGLSIKLKNEKIPTDLENYDQQDLVYENDFGKRYYWKNGEHHESFTMNTDYSGRKGNMFYSEFSDIGKFVVF